MYKHMYVTKMDKNKQWNDTEHIYAYVQKRR